MKSLSLIIKLWNHIKSNQKKSFLLVFLLMLLGAISEIITISSVIPFLTVILDPDKTQKNLSFFDFVKNYNSPNDLLIIVLLFFSLISIAAAIVRILLLWTLTKFSFSVGSEIANKIFEASLRQDYIKHMTINSSETINSIYVNSDILIFQIINPILNIINGLIMFLFIFSALFYFNPSIAISIFLFFGIIYLFIAKFAYLKLTFNSSYISSSSTKVIRVLQESLGGIKDIKINGTYDMYFKIFKEADLNLRKAQQINQFISASPRFIIESFGLIMISVLAYFLINNSEPLNIIPTLGVIALGAQRLLPIAQSFYSGWSSIRGYQTSLIEILNYLELPKNYSDNNFDSNNLITFTKKIELKNIYFKYNDRKDWLFKNLNLTIKKGSIIGIIGKTGSGKSSLLSILMTLIAPKKGGLYIDGIKISHKNFKSWRNQIAYVPQSIFLTDSSINENIAFGIPLNKINTDKVKDVAKIAQISSAIEKLKYKYKSIVGERGVRLSGGQIQRIGIARALYRGARIIIFDEATSALDLETENKIMQTISGLKGNYTIILIAHRPSTLTSCDSVYRVDDGTLSRIQVYG